MKQGLLVLDLGTSSVRALIIDSDLHTQCMHQCPIAIFTPKPSWVEQDPDEIWQACLSCITAVLSQAKHLTLLGICITNQRETTIVWEKETHRPIFNAIVWQCRRTAAMCQDLASEASSINAKTGLRVDPYFSATKLGWILTQNTDFTRQAKDGKLLFGTVDSWIIWKLTEGRSHVTDVSNASRTMLFNIHQLSYDEDLLALFKIPSCMLPQVLPSVADFGHSSEMFTGKSLPILAVLGDQQAALFSQCGRDRTKLKNTYGTGMFVVANTGNDIPKTDVLINTIAWQYDNVLDYAIEGSIFFAGAAIQWLRDNLSLLENSAESAELARSVDSNAGVYFVPALAGLGAPYWDPDASGLFIGLSSATTKAHFCRAVLESLAYQTKDVIDSMVGSMAHPNFKHLLADGGVSNNPFLMQFQADMLGIPVHVSTFTECTAYGIAGLAGIASHLWTEESFRSQLTYAHTYTTKSAFQDRQRLYSTWQKAVSFSKAWPS
ncbi:MAG: glycerol kinase GlpK [bacterium]